MYTASHILTCDTCRLRIYKDAAKEENNRPIEMTPVDTSKTSENPTDEVFDNIDDNDTYDKIDDERIGYENLEFENTEQEQPPSDSYQPLTTAPELTTGEQRED